MNTFCPSGCLNCLRDRLDDEVDFVDEDDFSGATEGDR